MTDIQIKIKTTYKPDINVVTVKSDAKVEDIMKEIEKYSQIPVTSQKLIFKGKILKPEEPISTYKIENDSTLIMVKSVSQANTNNTNNTSSSSAPSNNVSSNPEENITIKVKTNLDATVHEVPINKNATVLGLKGEIEKKTHIPPAQQKLVIKGKTMKDSDPISAYELNNESTIAMVKVDAPNQERGGLGGMPGLGGNPSQMMNDPRYQQIMNAVLNNPQMLNQLLNSPELRPIFEQNPQLRALLQNPQTRQLLLNPQLLERLGREGGGLGGMGGNPFAGLGLGSIQPTNSPNTRLGELFTQWMDRERNQPGQAQPPRQPQPGAGIGGANINPQPVFQQFPQPDPNVDYKEKYKEQIAQIKDMGIDDEEKIIDALKKCDGNVQYALNRLFG